MPSELLPGATKPPASGTIGIPAHATLAPAPPPSPPLGFAPPLPPSAPPLPPSELLTPALPALEPPRLALFAPAVPPFTAGLPPLADDASPPAAASPPAPAEIIEVAPEVPAGLGVSGSCELAH